MSKLPSALLLCLLCACTSTARVPAYSVCSTQPGTTACQIERYDHVD